VSRRHRAVTREMPPTPVVAPTSQCGSRALSIFVTIEIIFL